MLPPIQKIKRLFPLYFFLEILLDLYDLDDVNVKDEMKRLCKEANELVAIIVASINTAKNKLK